ncbi:hypothetical protein ACFWCA_43220 [Streptomyces phaeochromogenes]|uniref:hypothetical protein n=1 Tax=Streptomyces phaeochromogenes TaxID=1923 RepID=UPI00368FFAE1
MIENRSHFPAHRVILRNQETDQYAAVWVVNPCTRLTLDLREKGEEVRNRGAALYSLRFKMAGERWKTDDDRNIVTHTGGKKDDELLNEESNPRRIKVTAGDEPLAPCG